MFPNTLLEISIISIQDNEAPQNYIFMIVIRNFATWSCLKVNLLNIPPCVNISGFFLVIDRRYGHTTPTMATGAPASVVAIVGVVFTVIGKTNLLSL